MEIVDDLLWNPLDTDTNYIKHFALKLLQDIIPTHKFKKYSTASIECTSYLLYILDFCDELTQEILNEVKVCEYLNPRKLLESGLLSGIMGEEGSEHLIRINIDIKDNKHEFTDSFMWDILNQFNR